MRIACERFHRIGQNRLDSICHNYLKTLRAGEQYIDQTQLKFLILSPLFN